MITTEIYNEAVGAALRERFSGLRFASKLIARLVGGTDRAARNWMTGQCGPNAAALILLMAREPAIDAAIRTLVEQQRGLDAEMAARRARRSGVGAS